MFKFNKLSAKKKMLQECLWIKKLIARNEKYWQKTLYHKLSAKKVLQNIKSFFLQQKLKYVWKSEKKLHVLPDMPGELNKLSAKTILVEKNRS